MVNNTNLLKYLILGLSTLILICIVIKLIYYLSYGQNLEHFSNKEDQYKDFYDKLTSGAIASEDKCRLCRIKLQDKDDGINVADAVIQAAKDYLDDHCSDTAKGKKTVKVAEAAKEEVLQDIDPKSRDSLDKTYRNYCLPKFGEMRDKVPFDKYLIETDENGQYTLNGTIINKIRIDNGNCRRLEEYTKNKPGLKDVNGNKPINIDTLYDQCLIEYDQLGRCKKDGYNYYLSRDGKYYLNNEPLDRIKVTRANCEMIKDIKEQVADGAKTKQKELSLNLIDEYQRGRLCKKSAEYDYICSVYDKQKIMDYGKNHNKEPKIYKYITGQDEDKDFEYSFLTPSEFLKVSENIKNGKSGLTADNEIDLCFRKFALDGECKSTGSLAMK